MHQCARPCHTGPCRLCSVHIKRFCHCGITQLYLRCGELFGRNVVDEERQKLLSCGNQCTKLVNIVFTLHLVALLEA